jgi:shikimate dehydrogenase
MPHKQDIMPYLDEIDEEAKLAGAVNTVVAHNGRWIGYNTDMQGLLLALSQDGAAFRGRRIVILGTGGAARAITLKAAREDAALVTVVGRRREKAEEIRESVYRITGKTIQTGAFTPEAIALAAKETDILINATPLGMAGYGENFPSLAFVERLPPNSLVCDLVYQPLQTALLRKAASIGLRTQNGLGMLLYQALLADELYLNRTLDKAALFHQLSLALAEETVWTAQQKEGYDL